MEIIAAFVLLGAYNRRSRVSHGSCGQPALIAALALALAVSAMAYANVMDTVAAIKAKSPVLKEMADKGEIKIVGAMLDVTTGKVLWY